MFFSCSAQNCESSLWKWKINTHLITCFFELSYTSSGTVHNTQSTSSSFLVPLPRNGNGSGVINTLSASSPLHKGDEKNTGTDQKYKAEASDLCWFLETGPRECLHTGAMWFLKTCLCKCLPVVGTIWSRTWFSFVCRPTRLLCLEHFLNNL